MKLQGSVPLRFDWQRTLALGAVLIALAYGIVDRTIYAKTLARRKVVQSKAIEAWGALFDAQARAEASRHMPRRGWDDRYALTHDAVISSYDVLRQVAEWNDVRLMAFAPAIPSRVEDVIRTPVGVTVAGEYPNVVRFLTRIESSSLLFEVQSATIQKSDQPGGRITSQVSLMITTLPGALHSAPDSSTASITFPRENAS